MCPVRNGGVLNAMAHCLWMSSGEKVPFNVTLSRPSENKSKNVNLNTIILLSNCHHTPIFLYLIMI